MASDPDSSHVDGDRAVMWRPAVTGVEVLHASFRRHTYPRHSHESATVALVDAGAATFRYRNENVVATAGEVFLINVDTVHTGRAADDAGYRYRVLYLDAHALHPLLANESGWSPPLTFGETVVADPVLADLLHRAHCALANRWSHLLAEELLVRLGWLLADRYGAEPARRPSPAAARGVVSTALEHLVARPAERVSLRELAEVAEVSPYSLVRMFNLHVGMPPHAYQTQLRVRMARRLLAAGMPAAGVATQAGFYDQAHLGRIFKRYTGVTPGQFALGARPRTRPRTVQP